MKHSEVLSLVWYLWRRNNWMLDRCPRFDAKLRLGEDHCSALLNVQV